MAQATPPEIQRIDLSSTLLSIHAFGTTDPSRFGWFEPPASGRLDAANTLLQRLGAIDRNGKINALGHELLAIPASPRLGLLLREFHKLGRLAEAAGIAALLSERDIVTFQPGAPGRLKPEIHADNDLWLRLDLLEEAERARFAPSLRERGIDPVAARQVDRARDDLLRIARRWPESLVPSDSSESPLKALLRAFPDRVCRRRKADPSAALMVGGRAVRLDPQSAVRDGEFFLAFDPREDDRGTSREARVRLAAAIEADWLAEIFPDAVRAETSAIFEEERGRVIGVKRTLYHDLVIKESEHVAIEPEVASEVLYHAVRARGRNLIQQDESAAAWLVRYELLFVTIPGLELPEFDQTGLDATIRDACQGRRSLDELKRAPWLNLLKNRLNYAQTRMMDEYVPEAIVVPSGSRIKLHYEIGHAPVLAVRLQELFGWTETPRVALGRIPVVLHLLGPNYRPVQVTEDLRSFWASTYFQVRKDLRNRYPKHAWPEDPLNAKAEAKGPRRGP